MLNFLVFAQVIKATALNDINKGDDDTDDRENDEVNNRHHSSYHVFGTHSARHWTKKPLPACLVRYSQL